MPCVAYSQMLAVSRNYASVDFCFMISKRNSIAIFKLNSINIKRLRIMAFFRHGMKVLNISLDYIVISTFKRTNSIFIHLYLIREHKCYHY